MTCNHSVDARHVTRDKVTGEYLLVGKWGVSSESAHWRLVSFYAQVTDDLRKLSRANLTHQDG